VLPPCWKGRLLNAIALAGLSFATGTIWPSPLRVVAYPERRASVGCASVANWTDGTSGANRTRTVHVASTAITAGQSEATRNDPGCAPPSSGAPIVTGSVPTFA